MQNDAKTPLKETIPQRKQPLPAQNRERNDRRVPRNAERIVIAENWGQQPAKYALYNTGHGKIKGEHQPADCEQSRLIASPQPFGVPEPEAEARAGFGVGPSG